MIIIIIDPQTRALQEPRGRSKALEMVKNASLNNSSDLRCLSLGKRRERGEIKEEKRGAVLQSGRQESAARASTYSTCSRGG